MGSYPSLALTIFHISMCIVTMFLLLIIKYISGTQKIFYFEYVTETSTVISIIILVIPLLN